MFVKDRQINNHLVVTDFIKVDDLADFGDEKFRKKTVRSGKQENEETNFSFIFVKSDIGIEIIIRDSLL